MNPNENKPSCSSEIDASLRLPLLAIFGGAAVWLIVGLVLGLIAGIKFHAPEFLSACSLLTYGRVAPAANDAILYGFAIPAGLGVMLWVLARLSQMPLALPLVPVVAANLWNLGVTVGVGGILIGESTGHVWLEFPRAAAVLLMAAFILIAVSAAATFGWRKDRSLYPSHWFLFAALLWFPWIYSTANLLLNTFWLPRGVVQPIIAWWFGNNLVFVWLALVGVGSAFYFLPKISGKPLASSGYALLAFLTLVFFGSWCGIPAGAPVPAWLPRASAFAALLTVIPILAIAIITIKTVRGAGVACMGGPFCFMKLGVVFFVLSGFMYLAQACPQYSRVLEFTWFGFAQTQLQLFGFFALIIFGAVYEILPKATGIALPFPRLAKFHFFINAAGVLLFVIPLAIGGVEQGKALADSTIAFTDTNTLVLKFLRFAAVGQSLILIGALIFALNIFAMTIKWKFALVKSLLAAVKAPLPGTEVKA
jgi:cytochrome c oxidase cbb3-type subunit I